VSTLAIKAKKSIVSPLMDYIFLSLKSAVGMIFSLDPEVLAISKVSIQVSFLSTLIASLIAFPLGVLIASREFWGKRFVVILMNMLLSLPTIVVGLTVYAFFSRQGPFGGLGLLFTPAAMVIGQAILATPIICAMVMSAMEKLDPRVKETALTLGADAFQTMMIQLKEIKHLVALAILAGFGRVFAEVGISMMVGGNIRHFTRNITTAIALQTQKGEFELGLALGIILLSVAFVVSLIFSFVTRGGRPIRGYI
jgi:tungstate transport system permease protein